jgi:protoporphyrin/coproporphyrin ferrochelatase
MSKNAVLVMAYGGPDSLDDIEPYLLDIRGGRPTSPELIAEIRERYARIGGHSPLLEITRAQAALLEECLNALSPSRDGSSNFRVYVGMRHWKPYIRDVVNQIYADGFQRGVAFCMAPHASRMSSGAYQQKMREAQAALPGKLELNFVESWYDQPFLIEALARRVREAALKFPVEAREDIHYLFTAHSLPAVLKEQGDPYVEQLQQTARLLARALGLRPEQWTFGYQSAGAAAGQWLGPAIEELLPHMAAAGRRNILVTPVGFMADHVEILFDLDIEAQEIAGQNGIRLVRSASLNDSPDFIEGLAKFILERSVLANVELS